MAGGKETPRQKMIGMMYLVLTAMLALQVSSAIIEKFLLLNNSLELSSGAANRINQETVLKIKAAVEKSGSRAADVAVMKQADDVRKFSSDIYNQLNGLKQEIITGPGAGLNEEGGIKHPQEEAKVAELMIGVQKKGKGYQLKQDLNDFTARLNTIMPQTGQFKPLALDGKEDPLARTNKDQRGKDFAELSFESTPVAAALAVLSQKQTDIRRMEGEALNYLASKVGAQDIKFDRVLAMVSADAKTVVAGTKFKGQMFIAASASGITPIMSLNGGPVKVENGVGQIEFTAQGGGYNAEGLAKRELTGTIRIPTASGRDTTYKLTQEYFVVKPSYQIETGTLPPLYLGCANKLSIQSAALGALWAPSFTADGAEIINSGSKGKFTIVPSKANVTLTVSNQGSVLGTEPFRVQLVPKPTLEVRVNGTALDEKRGIAATAARSIQVVAIPDPSFKNFSPEDAQFRVSEIRVFLARGNRPVGSPVTLNGAGSISGLAQQAQPNDRYVIEIIRVERRNFKGNITEVEMGTPVKQISLY
jgi:gliding motility-associated protein GldM